MAAMRIFRIESIDEFRSSAAKWNDLWLRTADALPTGRAELIDQWLDHFAPNAPFVALVAEQDERFIAAIPLVERRVARMIRVGSLPRNDWCWAGHLLVDLSADVSQALGLIASEIQQLPWQLLWFDTVPLEQRGWRCFIQNLNTAGLGYKADERFQIGTVEIDLLAS